MILVTGATGHVGSDVLKSLAAAHTPARGVVHSQGKVAALRAAGVEAVVADLDDPATLRPALAGVDHVLLISPLHQQQGERERAVIDAAKAAGVAHMVKLSAFGVGPDAPMSFARTQYEIEQSLERSGMEYTHLRPNGFMQNFFQNAPTIAGQGVLYGSTGDGKISFIDVRDIADVAVLALTREGHAGKTYALTGPEALSHGDVAAIFSRELGREVRYVDLPPDAFKGALTQAGVPAWTAGALGELYAMYRDGYASAVTGTVQELTGRPPRAFAAFVRDNATAFA